MSSANPLFDAAALSNLDKVRRLLDGGADPNQTGPNGNTALIAAAAQNDDRIVRLLLERGARVDQRGNLGRTALFNAVHGKNTAMAQTLLDAGADLFISDDNGCSPVGEAEIWGGKRMQKFIRQIAQSLSPSKNVDLHQAAADGLFDQVKKQLEGGASVDRLDQHGCTPLMHAARRGQIVTVEALLAAGADPHWVSPKGNHVLYDAALGGNAEVVSRLLRAGVDVNLAVAGGLTALMMAATFGKLEAIRCLLEAGADPALQSENGLTALDYAKNSRKTLQFLKQALGVAPDATDALYDVVKLFKSRAEEPGFAQMLKRLTDLCGHEPYPWKKRKGVYRFWIRDVNRLVDKLGVTSRCRAGMIERLQDEVRDAGFLLVVGGSASNNPPLLLFPTDNPYAVILASGTNGNRSIDIGGKPTYLDAPAIVAWLRELAKTQPFVLTECGFDFLAGRFVGPVAHANALAERMLAFCPDLADDRGNSVDSLAAQLESSRSFYFWWD
jgi:ankyrin repeat protein